eukprot:306021-Amphidinium_carterae.1
MTLNERLCRRLTWLKPPVSFLSTWFGSDGQVPARRRMYKKNVVPSTGQPRDGQIPPSHP